MDTNKNAYIKVGEEVEPTTDELMLDKYVDIEYDTPYTDTDNYEDLLHVGSVIESGSIFDDR